MNYLPEGVVRNSEDGKFNLKGDVNQKGDNSYNLQNDRRE